jgi:hypothetical protein
MHIKGTIPTNIYATITFQTEESIIKLSTFIYSSMALQPCVEPWPLQFRHLFLHTR